MNKRIRKKQLKKLGTYVPSCDTWSLDITIAEFIIPRLKLFKKVTDCYPNGLESMEEWHSILDKMIKAFTLISEQFDVKNCFDYKYKEENKTINEGLDLFRKYYRSLWW